MSSNVQNILATAQKTLDDVNKKFPTASPAPGNPPAKHEYSSTPYSLVGAVKKATGNSGDMSKELAAKKAMVDKGKQALNQ